MPKHIYLIIVGIFSFGYIPPTLFPDSEITLLFLYVFMFFGFIYYRSDANNPLNKLHYHKWVAIIFILMFFSILTPCIRYNQSFIGTLIAMRKEYLLLYLSLFLQMNVQENDWYRAFKFLGILSMLSFFVVMFFPELYIDSDMAKTFYYMKSKGITSDVIATTIPGFVILIFFFFISFQRVIDNWRRSDVFWMLVSVVFIILMQNRSTIIGVIPPLIYIVSKLRIKAKMVFIPLLLVVFYLFFFDLFENLLLESQSQLSDGKYNRWQALEFFLIDWPHNIYTLIFGNGVACNGSQYLDILLDATKSKFAFISDIGLIGTFFQYGILLTIIIYSLVIRTMVSKKTPVYMKFYALWILLVPTIHGFGLGAISYTMKAAIFAYLAFYYLSGENKLPKTFSL